MDLLILILLYHAYMFWQREILFYSKPQFNNSLGSRNNLMSPVTGRLVYANEITVENNHGTWAMIKEGRTIPIPDCILPGKYLHIGIFMNPMNNHHMVTMYPTQAITHTKEYFDKFESMFSTMDFFKIFTWWYDWMNKKGPGFISLNRRTVMITNNPGITLCMIYDKFVNKLDWLYDNSGLVDMRRVIGFVHRGSQCDVFISLDNLTYTMTAQVGDKVNFNTQLLELQRGK